MQAFVFYLVYPFIWVLARLPFWLLYRISDLVFVIVYYLTRYRKKVIMNNLDIAFPEKSYQEKKRIARESMQHFCDNFIEIIKSLGISKTQVEKRFTCDNVDVVNAFAKAEQPVVIMLGHQASYEWTIALDEALEHQSYAVYKPIKNPYFDKLIREVRSKFGTTLLPMKKAYNLIRQSQKSVTGLYALVADQAPKPYKAQYFTQFFERTTAVLKGGERMAKQYGMPVFFLRVKKLKRGFYHATFEKITDDASKEVDWMVTDCFFELLEDQIKRQPEYYLWSHKRWKTSLKDATRAVELSPRVPQ
ncbi:lysophospholipid acyltransferase family protein [Nonlabens ponticola]|uniref:Acyltransferase n=1 Tax=Nonlabens ponticola TaxID=2496866 RepID=A0A3S9MYM5_9FLAO|nr:lysophospholipid acyltransferase family protein [Nonlabens ponticola]AZQ44257.1 acyltransferase [Nonlabens ponticola]